MLRGFRGCSTVEDWVRDYPHDVDVFANLCLGHCGWIERRMRCIYRQKHLQVLASGHPELPTSQALAVCADFAKTSLHKFRPGVPLEMRKTVEGLDVDTASHQLLCRVRRDRSAFSIVPSSIASAENLHALHNRRATGTGQVVTLATIAAMSTSQQARNENAKNMFAIRGAIADAPRDDDAREAEANCKQLVVAGPRMHYKRKHSAETLHRFEWLWRHRGCGLQPCDPSTKRKNDAAWRALSDEPKQYYEGHATVGFTVFENITHFVFEPIVLRTFLFKHV